MKLDRVTMTGADDTTLMSDLAPLAKRYPFVEWGILFSSKSQGSPRFPSGPFLKYLHAEKRKNPELKLSAHLCGQWVRDIVVHGENTFRSVHGPLWRMFDRVQLNFHGHWHKMGKEFMKLLPSFEGKQLIFQVDGVNDSTWVACQAHGDCVPFFDASHGAGVKPTEWPKPYSGVYNGYSGGLGPEDLTNDILNIAKAVGDERIWIDMETRIRSDHGVNFDLEKVEDCLAQAEPFIK